MLLRGLSPFGPIFGKELRTAARRRRNYFLRVAYLVGLLLFLLLAWTITRGRMGGGGVAQRAQQQAQLGFFFFAFFSVFCVGAMGLIGPVLTSTAINGERQAKTLHVLLMTPLTAWQIVSGKLFSRLLTALTLIGLSLPVLALVRLLGGVELEQMFGVVSLFAVTAMFGAAVGLLFSILIRRAYAVIILSYLLFAFLYLFAPMLVISLTVKRAQRLPWMHVLGVYNPFYAAPMLGWGESRRMQVDWPICVAIHVVATGVVLVLCSLLVRRLARREGEGATPAPAPALPLLVPQLAVGTDDTLIAPPPPGKRANRTVSNAPVLWRELRRPLMTRRWQRIAATLATLTLIGLAYLAAWDDGQLDRAGFQNFLACCFYTLMLLLCCVLSATCITAEKEGESWTVLLASPVSGSAIVWGKTLGVLRRLLWPTVLIVAHFTLFTLCGVITPLELLLTLAVMVMFNSIWIASGVALSLRFRKVTAAVITNLALPVALYGAGSLILAVIDSLLDSGDHLLNQVSWYLPYFYFLEGIWGSAGHYSTREFPALQTRVSIETYVLVAVAVGVLHVLAAAGLLAWTARRFNAIVGRAPQREPLPPQPLQIAAT